METEGKRILVNYLTDIADTFRSITGETDTISAESFSKEVQAVATSSSKNSYQRNSVEEMNAITDAKDGDTCLCCYEDSSNVTKDTTVSIITFPEEVVFENAITEAYYIHENKREYTLDLSYSPLLTHDSLMNIINNLYDIKSKGVKPQTLQLGDTNKAKLTAEEIAIATNKGWNVI